MAVVALRLAVTQIYIKHRIIEILRLRKYWYCEEDSHGLLISNFK